MTLFCSPLIDPIKKYKKTSPFHNKYHDLLYQLPTEGRSFPYAKISLNEKGTNISGSIISAPRKNRVCIPLLNTLTLFMTWSKIWCAIYDRCSWHSCPKHHLIYNLVDDCIDNDEKEASIKHTQFKTRVQNPPLFMTKMAKIDTRFLFMTKTAGKNTLWGVDTYIANSGYYSRMAVIWRIVEKLKR